MKNYIFIDKIVDDILDECYYSKDKKKVLDGINDYLKSYKKGLGENDVNEIKLMLELYIDSYLDVKKNKKIYDIYNNILTDNITLDEKNILDHINEKDKYLNKKSNLYKHNLLKIIVLYFIHTGESRLNLYNIYLRFKESKIIEVLVPRTKELQYDTIDYILQQGDKKMDRMMIDNIYGFMKDNKIFETTIEYKIKKLLKNKYVIPIVHDYVRIHDDNFNYSKFLKNKKQNYLKIMLDINYKISLLFNNINDVERKEIMEFMVNEHNYSTFTNIFNEISIYNRLVKDISTKISIKNYPYDKLKYILTNVHDNFLSFPFGGYGININLDIPKECLRYSSIHEFNTTTTSSRHTNIDYRFIPANTNMKLVGIAFGNKYDSNNYVPINKTHYLENIRTTIENIFDNKTNKKMNYWIFHENKFDSGSSSRDIIKDEIMNDLLLIYDVFHNELIAKLSNVLSLNSELTFSYLSQTLKDVENMFFKFDFNNEGIQEILQDVYNNRIKNIDLKQNETKLIDLNDIKLKPKIKYNNHICQHLLSWNNIKSEIRTTLIYSNMLFEFFNKYVETIYDGGVLMNYICKSCGEIINMPNYMQEGSYDRSGNFVVYKTYLHMNIIDSDKYKDKRDVIDYIEKYIEIISTKINATAYIGTDMYNNRINKVREIIDLTEFNNNKLSYFYNLILKKKTKMKYRYDKMMNESPHKKDYLKKQYITKVENLENNFLKNVFKLNGATDSEYSFVDLGNYNKDKSKFLILCYLAVILIMDFSNESISFIKQTKKFNMFFFKKRKKELFGELYISNKYLLNLGSLAYVIYMFSGSIMDDIKMKITIQNQKNVIHTILDIFNNILNIEDDDIDDLYKHVKENEEHITYLKQIIKIFQTKLFYNIDKTYTDLKYLKKIIDKNKSSKDYEVIEPKMYSYDDLMQKKDKYKSYILFPNKIINYGEKIKYEIDDKIIYLCHASGLFHNWKLHDDILKCDLCNKSYEDILKISWNDSYQKIRDETERQKLLKIYDEHGVLKTDDGKSSNIKYEKLLLNIIEKRNATQPKLKKKIVKYDVTTKYDMDLFLKNIEKHLKKNVDIFDEGYEFDYNNHGIKLLEPYLIKKFFDGDEKDNSYYKTKTKYFVKSLTKYFFNINDEYLGYYNKNHNKYVGTNILTINKKISLKNIMKTFGDNHVNHNEEVNKSNTTLNIKMFIKEFIKILWNIKHKSMMTSSSDKSYNKPKVKQFYEKYETILKTINLDNYFDNWSDIFYKNNMYLDYFFNVLTKLINKNKNNELDIYNLLYDLILIFYSKKTKIPNDKTLYLEFLIKNDLSEDINIYNKLLENSNSKLKERSVDVFDDESVHNEGYDLFDNDNDHESDVIEIS